MSTTDSNEQSGVGVMVGVDVDVAVAVGVSVIVDVQVGDGVNVCVGVLVGSGVGLGSTSVGSSPTIRDTRNCSTLACRLALRWSQGQIELTNGTRI